MNKIIIAAIMSIFLSSCSSSKVTNTESAMPTSASTSSSSTKPAMTEKEKKESKEAAIKRLTAIAIQKFEVNCVKKASLSSRVKKKTCTTAKQREQAKLDAQEMYRLATPLMGVGGDN